MQATENGTPVDDAMEWLALEDEQERNTSYRGVSNARPKFSNKPHPQSAYAHLPMRGVMTKDCGQARTSKDAPNPTAIRRTRRAVLALWPEIS